MGQARKLSFEPYLNMSLPSTLLPGWGPTWGEGGYGRVLRSAGASQCGFNCLNFYDFFGVGAVAYVNGTVISNPYDEDDSGDTLNKYLRDAVSVGGWARF
jgi:hypothetical protein